MAQKSKSARGPAAKPAKGKIVAGAAKNKATAVKKTGESLVSKVAKTVTATLAAVAKPAAAVKPAKPALKIPPKLAVEKPVVPQGKQEIAKAKKALAKAAKPAKVVVQKPQVQHTMNPLNAKSQSSLKPAKAEPKTRGRKFAVDINPNEATSALLQKWGTLYKKAEQIESKPYNMKAVFEEKTAIVHKVLGWGYILANRNDRLEVLFKDGIKYLISNYKP